MEIIKTEMDGVYVAIESVNLSERKHGMVDTSDGKPKIKDLDNILDQIKPVIKGLATRGSEALDSLDKQPDETEISFVMGFNAELQAWVLKGEGSCTFNVSMKWTK